MKGKGFAKKNDQLSKLKPINIDLAAIPPEKPTIYRTITASGFVLRGNWKTIAAEQ